MNIFSSCENNLDVCCDLDPNLKTSPGGKCGQRKIQAPSEGDDFTWKIDLPVGGQSLSINFTASCY